MDKLAILPFFLTLYLLYRGWDSHKAYVMFFLPVLTLIPAYYDTKLVSGIPEFTFWSSALIPIIIFWFFKDKLAGYQFSVLDVIIVLHLLFIFYAQFEATGYKDAQKILFRETLQRLMPYLLLKALLLQGRLRIKALVTITALGAVVSFFMAYEFKFYHNLLDSFIRQVWPFSVPWDGSMSRFGFRRAAGSFAHPISAGYFFAMVTPLALWLWREKLYPNQRVGLVILGLNALGVMTSISRAPIAGLLLSLIILFYGWSRSKLLAGGYLAIVGIIILAMATPVFVDYVSVTRDNAVTRNQENAAYRKEMLDNYIEVIKVRPAWGYGRYTFPVIKGQRSIDNEYLHIAITSGMNNLIVYLAIILLVLGRLLRFIAQQPGDSPRTRLAWALLAAWLSAIFTQATVYSGMQTTHYFFMLAAVSEALVINGNQAFVSQNTDQLTLVEETSYHGYNFSRTL